MDFELNEEQRMIRTTVRDFAEKEIAPVAGENSRNEHFPIDLIKKLGEMGLLGILLPAEYGGAGGDFTSYVVILEEIGKADVSIGSAITLHMAMCGKVIPQWGTEEQKRKYASRLASGEMLSALATTEPNVGSDLSGIETSAKLQGDEWVLNGNKTWITNGGVADVALVVAQTDKSKGNKGLTAFLVEKGTPGFTTNDIHNKLGVRASNTAELFFEDCRVPQENMLGPVGKGIAVALSTFETGRLGVAARSVGVAQACIDASISYAQTRKQFGKLLGSFQLIQAMIADMVVETEAARLLVYRAAAMQDKGLRAITETSMAKYYASETALKVANNAIQIHGSYGYSDDYPIERYFRDTRASLIVEGTSQIHKLIIGRAMTDINAFF